MKKIFLTLVFISNLVPAMATEITGGVQYKEIPEMIEVKLETVEDRLVSKESYDILTNASELGRNMRLNCRADNYNQNALFIYRNKEGATSNFYFDKKEVCKLIVQCLENDEVILTLDTKFMTVIKAHFGPSCETKTDPPFEYTNVLEEDYTQLDV